MIGERIAKPEPRKPQPVASKVKLLDFVPGVRVEAPAAPISCVGLPVCAPRPVATTIQRKPGERGTAAPGETVTPLPADLKAGIEAQSGLKMDDVKVHYNSQKPAQLHALAFAQGRDIYVGPGQEEHLAHEAWHVVQQAQGRVQPTHQMKSGVPVNDDRGLEQEADQMGARALETGKRGVVKSAVLGLPQRSSGSVIQPRWKNDGGVMADAAAVRTALGTDVTHVPDGLDADATLASGDVFLVAPSVGLLAEIQSGSMRAMREDKHIVGETAHGGAAWPAATAPWNYVVKMREQFKTYEKADEVGTNSIASADKAIFDKLGPGTSGDLALEGQNEYAISALTLVQQFLKGYDKVYGLSGAGADAAKASWYGILHERLLEVYVVLLRLHKIGEALFSKDKRSPKEEKYVALAMQIYADDGYKLIGVISKSDAKGKVTELGGFWQRNVVKDIQSMQALISSVVNKIVEIDGFKNMNAVKALNAGTERDRDDSSARVKQAVVSPETRDIRELEMVRRINAGPSPLLVQVGSAHLPGLGVKGVAGTRHATEAEFVRDTTKTVRMPAVPVPVAATPLATVP